MILSARRAPTLACRMSCLCLIVPLTIAGTSAAHAAGVANGANVAAPEARQFDFLVGQWQVSGEVKASGPMALIHGQPKLAGTWKAWRTADGLGVEDDLMLTDRSGTPLSNVHFNRSFSREANQWVITGRDAYKGALPPATARRHADEMLMTSSGTTPDGKPYRNRTHYQAITPAGFRMVQDRSYDEGKTWDTEAIRLDVRRAGN